eukprot:scaffold150558_cov18-Tisochrysis_lutea.AAC.1
MKWASSFPGAATSSDAAAWAATAVQWPCWCWCCWCMGGAAAAVATTACWLCCCWRWCSGGAAAPCLLLQGMRGLELQQPAALLGAAP